MSRTLATVLAAGSVAGMGLAGSAVGQTLDWNNPAGGAWETAANWLTNNVPDNTGENARFALGASYPVSLSSSRNIADLLLLDAGATLGVANGITLSVFNTTNNGVVTINPQGGGSATTYLIANGMTVAGTGQITLNASSGVLGRALLYSGSGNTWTHAASHTINGRGQVYYAFANAGLISADVADNTLQVRDGAIANTGTLRAIGAGTLNLLSESITQTGAGQILASGSGSDVELASASVSGGTLSAVSGGLVSGVSGNQTLTNVTVAGPLNINNGTSLTSAGLTNNGVITVNAQGGGSATPFLATAGTTVGGTGRITLNASSGVLDRAQLYSPTHTAWTHAAGHTIDGRGNIYYDLVNNGTISANAAGETLQLLNGTVTNNAAIQTAGGALALTSGTFNQSASGVIAASNGHVFLTTATVAGGTMTSTGASHIVSASGAQTLNGVALNGTLDINNGTTVTCPAGLTHSGSVFINTQGGGSATAMLIGAGATLAGSGTVTLFASSGVLDRAQLYSPTHAAWTNALGHTIDGRGNIYYDLANNGTISANVSGEVLQLLNGTVTNTGSLRTANGGLLNISSETVNQSGAGVIAATNGNVRLFGSTINGGALTSDAGQKIISASGTQNIGSVTSSAAIDINDSTTLACQTTITDNGLITVNAQGGGSATLFRVAAGQSVNGTGAIVLNASSGVLDRAYIQPIAGPWTHGASHTIRGRGRVYGDWTNNGLVVADAAAEVLELINGATANNGTLRAGAGTLTITNETVTQTANAVINAAGPGTVQMNSSTISGGRMTGATRFASASGNQTLTGGVILSAAFDVNNNSSLTLPTGLTNDGIITVNPQGGGSATHVQMGNGVTIGGAGSLILNASSGVLDRAYIQAQAGFFANGHGHTIGGTGRVYATWTNHGIVRPSGPSRQIDCQSGPYTQASDGTLTIDIAGPSDFAKLTGPMAKALAGTLTVNFLNGYVPNPCDSFVIVSGGPVSGRFATINAPTVPLGRMSVVYSGTTVTLAYVPADYNGDGFPDFFDYDDFVLCYETGICPEGTTADFNNDGFVDFFDYDAFVAAFEAGC